MSANGPHENFDLNSSVSSSSSNSNNPPLEVIEILDEEDNENKLENKRPAADQASFSKSAKLFAYLTAAKNALRSSRLLNRATETLSAHRTNLAWGGGASLLLSGLDLLTTGTPVGLGTTLLTPIIVSGQVASVVGLMQAGSAGLQAANNLRKRNREGSALESSQGLMETVKRFLRAKRTTVGVTPLVSEGNLSDADLGEVMAVVNQNAITGFAAPMSEGNFSDADLGEVMAAISQEVEMAHEPIGEGNCSDADLEQVFAAQATMMINAAAEERSSHERVSTRLDEAEQARSRITPDTDRTTRYKSRQKSASSAKTRVAKRRKQ